MYRPNIRSRHPSHNGLRQARLQVPARTVIRFGSTTPLAQIYPGLQNYDNIVELNTVEAVKNSMDKQRMKELFAQNNVLTAKWYQGTEEDILGEDKLKFPIVAKHRFGSRGTGNYLLRNEEDLERFIARKQANLVSYIFEQYHSYVREYRLHVTTEGCFYTCRKMIKRDTPEEDRWFRNDRNSVWILEDNPQFDKPINWDNIVESCIKAIKAVGLDFGACDVKVQGAEVDGQQRNNPKYFIIETNSAPSFGEVTLEKYKEELVNLANMKKNER